MSCKNYCMSQVRFFINKKNVYKVKLNNYDPLVLVIEM